MTKLSREQMKNVMGGTVPVLGCGTGISCSGKASGDNCGTKSCVCETHSAGDSTLYCTVQI